LIHPDLRLPGSLEEYGVIETLLKGPDKALAWNVYWVLARWDLFFLLKYVLSTGPWLASKKGIQHEAWIFDRCREVQENSNRVLDVWARFHWKSNIKTFANLIRYVLIDPNTTAVILSHTRPIAKQFMGQVQREIMTNELLKRISFDPDLGKQIFPDNPKELKRNSLDDGIIVNRSSNPREPTICAYGLVDSLPTGGHWRIRCYDDVVTKDSVSTTDMIKKTTHSWELSLPLGMPDDEAWYTGTFYAHDDTYHHIPKRGAKLRIHPCYEIDEENSELDPSTGGYMKLAHFVDKPVLYKADHLDRLFKEMGAEEGSRNADLQMLCDANAGVVTGFQRDWIKYYHTDPYEERKNKNVYILVDPANEKKKNSDFTAIWVVGLGSDRNLYVLDIVRDKMSLHERADKIFELHSLWDPLEVRYEQYGLQADIGHIEYLQEHRGYRFRIQKVGGIVKKNDRIERLVPLFRGGKIYLPYELYYTNSDNERIELVNHFIMDEYLKFPTSYYTDLLDSLARIAEPDHMLIYPDTGVRRKDKYQFHGYAPMTDVSWMGA